VAWPGRAELAAAMGSSSVVMGLVLGQGGPQVSLAEEIRNRQVGCSVAEVHQEIPDRLHCPRSVRVRGHAEDVHLLRST